ncbi:MAG: chromosome segregation protein SMC [Candidatus Eisenbacteria bacterium]
MYVEKIELYGFKSFPNRTEIPFARGITAIVGPNGCGKSNVSDAFRWVIGESNIRNLRGERVQDVIFKGTRTAKPMGMAEVTLTIRNDEGRLPVEYTQVGVARRIFRSGDSEFAINKSNCRLKDIRELFSGTGMGSHGYAVIERSMIDEVLSDKDDARRFLFEEAAGIVLYKQRRKEAQRKLQGVEGDLVRIEDMIREIEREVRSLARQAGKVRRWRTFKDELDRLEVREALTRWQKLNAESESVDAIRKENQQRREDIESKVAALDGRHSERRQVFVQLGDRLSDGQRRLNEATLAVSKAHEEMQVLATRNASWKREEADLRLRLDRDKMRLTDVRGERTDLGPRITEMNTRLGTAKRRYEEAREVRVQAEEELRSARKQLDEVQQLHLDLKSTHSESRKDLEGNESRRAENRRRMESLASHLGAFGERRVRCQSELEQVEQNADRFEERLADLEGEREELEVRRASLEESQETAESRIHEIARSRAGIASRLAVLEEQHANHEGFDAAVQWVLKNRDDLDGFVGVVGEEVRLKSQREEMGRAVLGDRVSWVLVRNEDAAIEIIGRLREEQLGGVTFFPLAEAGGRDVDVDAAVEDLFDVSGSALPFLRYLSGTSRLADDVDTARRGAEGSGARSGRSTATPEGLLFGAEGAIYLGGVRTREAAILSREQEIPALSSEIDTLDEESRQLGNELARIESELSEVRARGEALRAETVQLQRDHRGATERRSALRTELSMLEEEQQRLTEERLGLESEIARIEGEIAALVETVARSGEDSTEAQERFDRLRSEAEAKEEQKDKKVREATERELEALRLENDHKELVSLQARLEKEETEKAESVQEIERIIAERSEEAAAADSRIEELGSGLEQLQESRREIEAEVREIRDEHAESQVAIAELEDTLKAERSRLEQLVRSMHEEDMARVEARAEAEQIRRRIEEEYRVDLAAWTPEGGFPEPEVALTAAGDEESEAGDEGDEASGAEAGDGTTVALAVAGGADAESAAKADLDRGQPGDAHDPHGEDGEEDDEVRLPKAKPRPVVQLTEEDGALTSEERREQIVQLRRRIEGMGMLNYLAEEEYETQKERLDFHSQQAKDLHESRSNLLETIRQINETAGQMFQSTFDEVQTLFVNTFQELFPGGEASIRLVGTDPLESDVEVSARPRGKRLESIRLLSTGERSLTAIALLFSLYMIKPSPVCLLDEVDAPLDDANLDRFLAMLRKVAKRTQFIMITHNKKTMKCAENLFGVTMEEPGISKIVSVRLNEHDLDLGEPARTNGAGDAATADA